MGNGKEGGAQNSEGRWAFARILGTARIGLVPDNEVVGLLWAAKGRCGGRGGGAAGATNEVAGDPFMWESKWKAAENGICQTGLLSRGLSCGAPFCSLDLMGSRGLVPQSDVRESREDSREARL